MHDATALNLDAATTALVLIDLQQGILPYAKAPRDAAAVLANAAPLADAFRAAKAPVVLVKVGFSADGGDVLKTRVDAPNPPGAPPANWLDQPAELPSLAGDLHIVKRQWGAFYGTELDQLLRRRGIKTLLMAGIATNIGVESTAREAFDRGYELVFAEDAMSTFSADAHHFSCQNQFKLMGRVRSTEHLLQSLRAGTGEA